MDNSQRKHDEWVKRYGRRENPNYEEYKDILSKNNFLLENVNKGVTCISKRSYSEAIQILSGGIKTGQQLLSEDNLIDECELAKAYLNRGVAYEYLNKHEEAFIDKNKSVDMLEELEIRNELDDRSILDTARENLRITKNNMKPVEKSQERRFNSDRAETILKIRNNAVAESKRPNEKSNSDAFDTNEMIDIASAIERASKYTMDGLAAFQNDKCGQAITYFNDAINLMESLIRHESELDYDILAKAYVGRGLAYSSSRNPERSKSDLLKGVEIWDRLKSENKYIDETMLNYARTILTTVFNVTLQKTDNSLLNSIDKDNFDFNALVTSRIALGVSFDQREEFEKANVYYTECIQLFEESETNKDASDKSSMALAYMNRASNYYSMGNIDKALPDYNRAIDILLDLQSCKKLQDDFDLFMAYKNRSQAYEREDDMVLAIDDIISALRVLKGMFKYRLELQEHYYEVLEELIEMIDFEDDDAKKQSVLNEFLYSMRQIPKKAEAEIAQNRLIQR